jgi:predicted PurR-regulated permease PerM
MMNSPRTEVARTTLAVLFIGLLIAASGWILRPFLPALIWATMVVVATWPVMLRVQRQFGNRRAPAVMVMTLLVLLVLVVPLSLAIATLVENAQQIVSWGRFVASFRSAATPSLGSQPAACWPQA